MLHISLLRCIDCSDSPESLEKTGKGIFEIYKHIHVVFDIKVQNACLVNAIIRQGILKSYAPSKPNFHCFQQLV